MVRCMADVQKSHVVYGPRWQIIKFDLAHWGFGRNRARICQCWCYGWCLWYCYYVKGKCMTAMSRNAEVAQCLRWNILYII